MVDQLMYRSADIQDHLISSVRPVPKRPGWKGGGGVCVSPGWSLEMGEKGREELAGHLWSDGASLGSPFPVSLLHVSELLTGVETWQADCSCAQGDECE